MEVTIYANYGVLAHEKQAIYTTAPEATADLSEPFWVIIPDALQPYETIFGEIALTLPGGYNPYLLREVLAASRDAAPVLAWIDRDGRHQQIPLDTCGE